MILLFVLAALAPLAAAFGVVLWGVIIRQDPHAAGLIRAVAIGLAAGVALGLLITGTLIALVLGLSHLRSG